MSANKSKLISIVCNIDASKLEISDKKWQTFQKYIKVNKFFSTHGTKGLDAFLQHVLKNGKLLDETLTIQGETAYYFYALLKIFQRKGQWCQDYKNWQPVSRNTAKQFSHLLNHLFGPGQPPRLLENVWFRSDRGSYRYRDWYVNLCQGQKLYEQKSRVPIDTKMVCHFYKIPSSRSVEDALVESLILSLGGERDLVKLFLESTPYKLHEHYQFWRSFLLYCIKHPTIITDKLSDIVDYLNFQKFESRTVVRGGKTIVELPPDPDFQLEMLDPRVLSKLTREWRKISAEIDHRRLIKFPTSDIREYIRESKAATTTIRQLKSNWELAAEDDSFLGACNIKYTEECLDGELSVWSFSRLDNFVTSKVLTLYIDTERRLLYDIRGKSQRFPRKDEMLHIRCWMEKEGLTLCESTELFIELSWC